MEIAYTAHTETCTLLLDADGICRSVLAASSRVAANGGARPTRIPSSAERCVGAQYVATLDLREAGGMTAMPQPGAQMLFARTEESGRITLIRSAPVVRFEAAPAKRVESGVHARPEQSAPEHRAPEPRAPEQPAPPQPAPAEHKISYGDDDELTLPFDAPTIQGRRSSLPPAPPRNSGIVPAARTSSPSRPPRTSVIPRPPRAPRVDPSPDSITRPTQAVPVVRASVPTIRPTSPSLPRHPSVVRPSSITVSEWDVETRPGDRAARR